MFDRFIAFFAQVTPQDLAISTLTTHLTYREFDADIDRFTAALAEHDPPRPGLVAVCIADRYTHWVALAALARLGVTSASYYAMQRRMLEPLMRPDLVITDEAEQADDATRPRLLRVTGDWVAEVGRRPAIKQAAAAIDPDGLARVMTSSGTTGLPKKIGISWRCVENRIMHNATIGTMKGARSLSAIGPEFYPYPGAFIDWARGATVVFGPDNVAELANALTRLRPSVVALAPIQLKVLLDCLPPGFRAMPELTIGVSGSHTPRALREAVRLRLSPNLINAYMSTEAGLMAVKTDIGEIDDADVGPPSPWANVEIVDDEGRPAPPGEIGVIRIRSPDCVSGYIDDEEATARFFRNGWFYPGDVGFMSPEGRLRVEGRLDEVINFAGTKFIPHLIEGAVLACQGVMDVGVFSMRDETGFNAPWIAIVRGESLVEAELLDALRTLGVPPANFVWIDVIPRTPSGKVHREQLQTAVIRHREQESASAVETESLSKSDA